MEQLCIPIYYFFVDLEKLFFVISDCDHQLAELVETDARTVYFYLKYIVFIFLLFLAVILFFLLCLLFGEFTVWDVSNISDVLLLAYEKQPFDDFFPFLAILFGLELFLKHFDKLS